MATIETLIKQHFPGASFYAPGAQPLAWDFDTRRETVIVNIKTYSGTRLQDAYAVLLALGINAEPSSYHLY